MTDTDQILDRIRSGLARHGRKKRVSEDTGITQQTLAQVSRPDWNPSAETMRKLDASLAKLFPADRSDSSHQPG